MLAQLAWKNIWRNKTRSLVVLGSVVLGIWVGTFMMAYALGVIDQRLQDAVADEISHFQVHHPAFKKDKEAVYQIPNSRDLLGNLRGDARIKCATGRVLTYGIAASSITSTSAKIIGIDPDAEDLVTGLKGKLLEGAYFDSSDKNKIILGRKLGDKLGLKLRSKIVLTFQDVEGNIASGAFRVIGFYETYNSTYDELNVFVRDRDLARLLSIAADHHEIAVLVHRPDSLDSILNGLRSQYSETEIEDWKEISPELGLMVESFDQYMVIFLIIILLALTFGIINTMLMAVLERVREIGMLMAIGMNKWRVFLMIGLETIYLVLISAPFGLLFAYLSIAYLGNVGIDLSGLYEESYASFGIKTMIYPKLTPTYYWQILIMVIVTAILAAIYPAFTAVKLDPVKAMRKI